MDILNYPFDSALILQKKRAIRRELLLQSGLTDKKIAIVSGSTVGDLKFMLELFLLNAKIRPVFFEGEYGLFYEDVVFDGGSLAEFAPDLLYIHTSSRNVRLWPSPADTKSGAAQKLDGEFARFEAVWQAAKKLGCPVVQNNFEPPAWRNFGNLDAQHHAGRVLFTRRLNEKMALYAENNPGFYIHDFSYLASAHGLDAFCGDSAWYAYKYACDPAFLPELAHSLCGLIKGLFGHSKKAAVTDLDNTLWGGVIGEVGAKGVELGNETPSGMAYSELQSYLLMLRERGVLLAVASKNETEAAESGFAREDSRLKYSDFLAFKANWGPKSQSVGEIAQELNIGADSIVFIDDNPAERAEVRGALPMVEAPPFGAPEDSVRLLDRGAYFEVNTLSADDMARTGMYRQNAERQRGEAAFTDYRDYLLSLEMQAEIKPFRQNHMERITQLINKTNQFNLTTLRLTLAEADAFRTDAGTLTLYGRLTDKFGDNGITTALAAQKREDALNIILWVMSCRVFKRELEYAVFDALMAEAIRLGVKTVTGRWLPTPKNLLVKDFYATIGFGLVAENETERLFSRTVSADYTPLNTTIKIL